MNKQQLILIKLIHFVQTISSTEHLKALQIGMIRGADGEKRVYIIFNNTDTSYSDITMLNFSK